MTKALHYLRSPWAILSGIFCGVLIAIFNKKLALAIFPIGQIYLKLIQMLVMPIMITAVISSFGHLFHKKNLRKNLKNILLVLIISVIIVSAIAVLIGFLGAPGSNLDESARALVSQKIFNLERLLQLPADPAVKMSFLQFLNNLVPFNIFVSIDQNNMLGVLLFCTLLGIGLGCLHTHGGETAIITLESTFNALLKIVGWIMYGMPIGMCLLFAGYMSQMSGAEIMALSRLIFLIYLVAFLVVGLHSLVLWRIMQGSYRNTLLSLKDPLLIAFGTSSSMAAIPVTIENLQKKLNLDRNIIDAVVPLGSNLNRQGSIIRFVIVTIFTAHLFSQPITFAHAAVIFIMAILASIVNSGSMGSISILALVLQPLGLPATVGIVLLATVVPITDPAVSMVNACGNYAAAAIVAKRKQ